MTTASRAPDVIIGIGNPVRRDDGVGAAVIDRLTQRRPPIEDIDLVALDGEPARVVEQWHRRRLAVVIDAVRAGAPPGTIHRLEVGVDPIPSEQPTASSHTTGLAEAVALATALDRLPSRLVLLGVEPGELSVGIGLTPSIAAAVPAVADRALHEVSGLDPRPSTRS